MELDSLLPKEEEPPKAFWNAKKVLAVSSVVGLAVLGVSASNHSPKALTSLFSKSNNKEVKDELVHDNEYERKSGRQIGNGVYKHNHLASVHRPTRFALSTGKSASWSVLSPGSSEFVNVGEGEEVHHTFTTIGAHKVKAVRADGEELTFDMDTRVTRHEIRDLSEQDRNKYLETMHRYYNIGEKEGLSLYGETYMSWSAVVRLHIYGAATTDCDHWHDDAGMANHHLAVTLVFEQSMRAIDPTVAAHYWDYTREEYEGFSWDSSNMFRDDWFGSNSPTNGEHIVDTGRWAYTKIMTDATSYSSITNPYGLLRSPWNTNPVPYLIRYDYVFKEFADGFSTFPSCTDFADYVGYDFAHISNAINGILHGPVHLMVGGSYNQKASWLKKSESFGSHTGDNHLLLSKFMWRQGWIRTPSSCSVDTPGDECMATCPSEIIGDMTALEVLRKSRIVADTMKWTDDMDNSLTVYDDDAETHTSTYTWEDYLDILCHVGYAGEMFTSSAPQDPLFWPLHGNAERYIQALQYYKAEGTIDFDETWGYYHDSTASDMHLVCDWSNVEKITDMPECTQGVCTGHRADDLLPFTNLYMVDGLKTNYFTNAEFAEIFQYDNNNLPYVYDSVTYWEACTDHNLVSESKVSTTTDEEKLARLKGTGCM